MAALALAAGLSGCAHARSNVAYVNVAVLQSTWPKFINYQNQLQANLNAIQSSRLSQADKQRELQQLNQQNTQLAAQMLQVNKALHSLSSAQQTALSTDTGPAKLAPRIVNVPPPDRGPEAGVMEMMVGDCGR